MLEYHLHESVYIPIRGIKTQDKTGVPSISLQEAFSRYKMVRQQRSLPLQLGNTLVENRLSTQIERIILG